jgi:arylsulfatase A-like enzyme
MHGATLFDEIVQVPLILSAPGRIEPGVLPFQVSLVDLMPTLLDLGGAPIDGLDGQSLLPLADGRERGDREALIAGTDKGALSQLAIRTPRWKLILDVESGAEQAYRLDLDPRERTSRPEDVPAELRARLAVELDRSSVRRLSAEEEALVERRLADLGYVEAT